MIVTIKTGNTVLTDKAFYKTEQEARNAVSIALDGTVYYQTGNATNRIIIGGACSGTGKTDMETAHRNGSVIGLYNGTALLASGYIEEMSFGDPAIGGWFEFGMTLIGGAE